MAVTKTVLVFLCLLFMHASGTVRLDCGMSPPVEDKSTQLTCTGINPAATVEWRHPISRTTTSDIIISSCRDQNVCKDNDPSRYRATRPTSDTSVLTIANVSRDDAAQWTCRAGTDEDVCAVPAAIYPADVSDPCLVTMTEDSVEVTCTISKAYPSSINCVWYEHFVPDGGQDLGNGTRTTQIPENDSYLENRGSFTANGRLYYNASCRLQRNVTDLHGTLNYTVVVSPGPVFRSSVVTATPVQKSTALPTTPDSAASKNTSDSATLEITASSNTVTRNTTSLLIPMSAESETTINQSTSTTTIIGVVVGVFLVLVLVVVVGLVIHHCRRRTSHAGTTNERQPTPTKVTPPEARSLPSPPSTCHPASQGELADGVSAAPVNCSEDGGQYEEIQAGTTNERQPTPTKVTPPEARSLPSPPPTCHPASQADETSDGYEVPSQVPQQATILRNKSETTANRSAGLPQRDEQTTPKNYFSSSSLTPQRSAYLTLKNPSMETVSEGNSLLSLPSASRPASQCSASYLTPTLTVDSGL